MPFDNNFIAYHQSLAAEFNATKDQIRNLIGGVHWPSDGGHKEAILRRVLQNKLPETFRVGTGFFSDTSEWSKQIDILITDASKPTLFRNGDFFVVTPDCVRAIIEVKTDLNGSKKIKEVVEKLANDLQKVRRINPLCWAGLFIYEGPQFSDPRFQSQCEAKTRDLLKSINQVAQNDPMKAINCVTIGSNAFIRFWAQIPGDFGGRLRQMGWQSYIFNLERHRDLSPAYFVGNLVMHLTAPEGADIRRAWFPIQDGNGKEEYCFDYIEMGQNRINSHERNT